MNFSNYYIIFGNTTKQDYRKKRKILNVPLKSFRVHYQATHALVNYEREFFFLKMKVIVSKILFKKGHKFGQRLTVFISKSSKFNV